MTELRDPGAYRSAAAAEVRAFTALAAAGDPSVPVPSCAGWTYADLVRHVGRIHRWVAAIVGERLLERPDRGRIDYRFPAEPAALAAWQAECSAELLDALAAADPDAPVWTWGPGGTVRWWLRRMLHETTVHRADAELALGRSPALASATAVDGIGEFLANLPATVGWAPDVAKLTGTGETILFQAVDTADCWLVTLRPNGFDVGRDAVPDPDARYAATADSLYLRLWGRPTPTPVRTSGAESLTTLWTRNSRT